MPRTKTRSCPQTILANNAETKLKNNKENELKVEAEKLLDDIEAKLNNSFPDLSKFKYEKKSHLKIEFEKESPEKQEGNGLWEPPNWQEFLVNLRTMRANNDAPVDTMGCHMSMDDNAPPEVFRYQSLISLMLSSQTKDQVTFAAMERLRARGLTVDNVLKLSDDELGKLIYPVGFWKTKVKYIKKTTQTLKEQYNGDIPDSVEKLCKLTGVGPKMAHICMKVAWNKVTGIGVDTHVHRISNRIGWVKKPTATPEDTRKSLQSWIPFDLWSEVNHLMVGFGQTICLPIGPTCHECLNRDICPSSGKCKKSPMKLKATDAKSPKSPMKLEGSHAKSPNSPMKLKATDAKSPKKIAAKNETVNEMNDFLIKDMKIRNAEVKPEKSKQSKPRKTTTDETNIYIYQDADNFENIETLQVEEPVKKVSKRPAKKIEHTELINTERKEMDNFKTKTLKVDAAQNKKINTKDTKLIQKKAKFEDMENLQAKTANVAVHKRKTTPKKIVINSIHSEETFDFDSNNIVENNTKQNLKVDKAETKKATKSPVKRKSPRNKTTLDGDGNIKRNGSKKSRSDKQ